MITLTARKVRVTDSSLGSTGARLSNTASGKARSMANHPAGKGRTRERSVYEGLLLNGITDEQARFADEESDKWLAEYDEKRLEIQARLDGQAMVDAQRRKDFLRHMDGGE